MNVIIHNPDQYMSALRTIVAQGRKRVGLLVGAGAGAGMAREDGKYPLIPAVVGLTDIVLTSLQPEYGDQITALKADLAKHDIETILSRIRSLSQVLGSMPVHGLDGPGYKAFGDKICQKIGEVVSVDLPSGRSAYSDLVNWISGANRDHPVEIFTTNYDLLFEEALERAHAPYYDGFTGGKSPFFDPVSVSRNDLPTRWTRLWKLHGSLGWKANDKEEVIRTGEVSATHLVFPEHLKYDQTQKAPYSALLDRLRSFLMTPDTLLISIGFSFADAHISSKIDEALAANPSASVFAFQYKCLDEEEQACALAKRLPNFSVYARDAAKVNGVRGKWTLPNDLPSKDWGPIRKTYWSPEGEFTLGAIEDFASFLATSRSAQALKDPVSAIVVPLPVPVPVAAITVSGV